ncbi:unnamed protein product [Moneuplotes crassus]|uniref:Uncharacterized protein n=1 Tax=Euplotes crassus TaxID=5936 RepID=A0AAD1U1N8_EUPCR|nr:unnamed protein product [Moneuplotes crassus]
MFSEDGVAAGHHDSISTSSGYTPLTSKANILVKLRSRSVFNFTRDRCLNLDCSFKNRSNSRNRENVSTNHTTNADTHISCSRAYKRRHRGTLGEYLFTTQSLNNTFRFPRKSLYFDEISSNKPKFTPKEEPKNLTEEVVVIAPPTILNKKRIFSKPDPAADRQPGSGSKNFKEFMNNPYKYQKCSGKLGKHLQKSIHKKYTPQEALPRQKFTLKNLEKYTPGYLKCTENSNIREYMIVANLEGDKKLTKEQIKNLEDQIQTQRMKFMRKKDKMTGKNTDKDLGKFIKKCSKNKDLNMMSGNSLNGGKMNALKKERRKRVSKEAKSQKTAESSRTVLDPENNAIYISNRLQNSHDGLSLKGQKSTRKSKKSSRFNTEQPDLDCPKVISDNDSCQGSPLARSKSPSERTLNKYLQMLLDEKNGVNRKERSFKGKKPQNYDEIFESADSGKNISNDKLEWQSNQFEHELEEQQKKYHEQIEDHHQADQKRSRGDEYSSTQNGGSKNIYSSAQALDNQKVYSDASHQVIKQGRMDRIKYMDQENFKTFENLTDQAQGRNENIPYEALEQAVASRSNSPLIPRIRSKMTTKEHFLKSKKSKASVWVVPDSIKVYTEDDKKTGFNFQCEECVKDPSYVSTKKPPFLFIQ